MSVYVKHITFLYVIFNIYFNENEDKTISIWFTTPFKSNTHAFPCAILYVNYSFTAMEKLLHDSSAASKYS